MTSICYHVKEFLLAGGKSPYRKWLMGLDMPIAARVQARTLRLEQGNFGDCRHIGYGVHELRCHFGGGYRIYFGKADRKVIVLLLAGDKSSQKRDIVRAQRYWKEYLT